MSRVERIQDGVHGLMEFVDMQTAVVEVLRMPEIQRLRRVRQLGLAHLVFPGAEHSRLVHSVGASHLAVRFVERIIESSQDYLPELLRPGQSAVRDVALAALCHDIGHGPLSHMWEREVIRDFDRRAWCETMGLPHQDAFQKLHWHEFIGQALLNWEDGPLHQFLEQLEEGTSLRIAAMLRGKHYIPYLPMLLSNDVDVDRADFILRDAQETGVQYGRYDLNWLISTITVGEAENKRLVVGFDDRKAPRVVEQFLVARRALYDTVYYHKTVQSAEAMMGLLLRRLKSVLRDGAPGLLEGDFFKPYRTVISGQPVGPSDILLLDDYGLWVLIHELVNNKIDKTLGDLAQRIISRDLFKAVPCASSSIEQFFSEEENVERLRRTISESVTGDPAFYYEHKTTKIKMLNDSPADARVYFIDTASSSRPAKPGSEHRYLSVHWAQQPAAHWLFVPAESRDAVAKIINRR
jgi:HD superfamily phosphohydrolase